MCSCSQNFNKLLTQNEEYFAEVTRNREAAFHELEDAVESLGSEINDTTQQHKKCVEVGVLLLHARFPASSVSPFGACRKRLSLLRCSAKSSPRARCAAPPLVCTRCQALTLCLMQVTLEDDKVSVTALATAAS